MTHDMSMQQQRRCERNVGHAESYRSFQQLPRAPLLRCSASSSSHSCPVPDALLNFILWRVRRHCVSREKERHRKQTSPDSRAYKKTTRESNGGRRHNRRHTRWRGCWPCWHSMASGLLVGSVCEGTIWVCRRWTCLDTIPD